ncbi:hypothetical protein TNCV_1086541 [Trichonephila clavipes]|nr:hypothetical protein TNCV_1086541 [Trichonephila clavipes]
MTVFNSSSLQLSDSREQGLESDCRHHQNHREFESQEQHDVTEQCGRYHESQGQRTLLPESAICQSQTNSGYILPDKRQVLCD